MAVGVGSISRMLVVLQKINNTVVRCQLCWVPLLRDNTFDKTSGLFLTLCQLLLDRLFYVTWLSRAF